MTDPKPFRMICEVDDDNKHSWGDEFATEEGALAAMGLAFVDGLRHAHQSVVAYVDLLGDEEFESIGRLAAYRYRGGNEEYFPSLDDLGVPYVKGEVVVVAEAADGDVIYARVGDYEDDGEVAKDFVRQLFRREGGWQYGARVMTYIAPERVLWIWEAGD